MSIAPSPAPVAAAALTPASLVELLSGRAADACDRPAVITWRDGAMETVSWGGLVGAALDYARVLEAAGLGSGDRLAHVGPHAVEWIVVDLACLLSGIVHVALHDDEPVALLRAQLDWLVPRGLVATGGRSVRGVASGAEIIVPPPAAGPHARQVDDAELTAAVGARAAACDPDAPAAIFLSSGTTGQPRAVVHCQRALAWNAEIGRAHV